jgi:hypothetical protein
MALDLLFGKTKRNWGRRPSGRRPWSIGSVLLPARQEKVLLDKVDDVRYDVRRAGERARTGLLVLSAAVGFVALSGIYATSKENR